jgi:hypothetical protein
MSHSKGPWQLNKQRTCVSNNEHKILDVQIGLEPKKAFVPKYIIRREFKNNMKVG